MNRMRGIAVSGMLLGAFACGGSSSTQQASGDVFQTSLCPGCALELEVVDGSTFAYGSAIYGPADPAPAGAIDPSIYPFHVMPFAAPVTVTGNTYAGTATFPGSQATAPFTATIDGDAISGSVGTLSFTGSRHR